MKPASLLRRLGAILYDSLLVFALLALGTIPFLIIGGGEAVPPGTIAHQLTLLATAYLFFVGFWTYSGRTLGMQSWGLQLQQENGALPTWGQASLRFFAAIISWAALGFGFWWQLWDAEQRCWHDRVSNTRLMYYPKSG